MEFYSFNQQNNIGTMDEEEDQNQMDSISSSSSSSEILSGNSSDSDSDLGEEVNSSETTSSSASNSSISGQVGPDPLHDMSSLLQQLPIKRGLSKHFQGKSQSFTSLSNVRSLEDLAKPENPCNKKLKSCKSYGGLLSESHKSCNPSRLISKKTSRGSSSLGVKRTPSCLGNKPRNVPHPYRSASSSSFSNQTPLFA